jgi:hypothetical protein
MSTHLIFSVLITLTMFTGFYKLRTLLFWAFLHFPLTSCVLRWNILLTSLFSNTFNNSMSLRFETQFHNHRKNTYVLNFFTYFNV